jgi:competence protein ComEA
MRRFTFRTGMIIVALAGTAWPAHAGVASVPKAAATAKSGAAGQHGARTAKARKTSSKSSQDAEAQPPASQAPAGKAATAKGSAPKGAPANGGARKAAGSRSALKARATPGAPVNLNGASVVQLQTLPGVGASTAQRIIDYRQKNGSFKKVEELMNVKGIGEKSFLKLKPLISVGTEKASADAQK